MPTITVDKYALFEELGEQYGPRTITPPSPHLGFTMTPN